ncbi:MAG: hypothetical protein A2X61_09040 [Ignavibacteria bacterium GWB2_35_12]|nr:MAG: hypothetical protein A2X63_04180 [Ignavibacteria bacterium GWA2_35_8]OGU40635.1 MAG: hypothetical protein A2X61_09040 [Ignavibacteria bacterium GWB2_35_12]OGV22669.1 MAG: hypothetical protein A2475_13235 [Ignavibacteria bacterium RIFOXYC2_FULL_35_21]
MVKEETNKEELSLRIIFRLINLNRKFTLIVTGVVIILTLLLSFIVPYEYEATATVLPPEETGGNAGLSSFLQSLSGGLSVPGLSQGNKLELLADITKSREVAKYISKKLNLKSSSLFKGADEETILKAIDNILDVRVNRNGLIVVNSVVGTPYFSSSKSRVDAAKLSAEIANAAVEGLDFINRRKNVSKARKKRLFIERMLVDNKLKLDSVDNALESFQKKNKVLAIDEQTKAILENAVNVGTELSKSEVELNLLMQDYEINSPKVKAYKKKVEGLQEQYNRTQRGGLVPNDNISIPLTNVPTLVKEYTNLIREQKIMAQVILYLETQKYQEAIQEESDIATVETLDRAEPPHDRLSPDRKFMLIMGLIFGLLGAVAFLLGKDFYKGNLYIKRQEKQETEI